MRVFECADPKCKYTQKTAVKGKVEFSHRHGVSRKIHRLKEVQKVD